MIPIYEANYEHEPDWASDEELLFSKCCEAIIRFTQENPNKECSFLAFDSEPCYGYVIIAFDTRDQEVSESRKRQLRIVESRDRYLAKTDAWEKSRQFISERSVHAHCESSGSFAFPHYETVNFPMWEPFIDDFYAVLPPEDAEDFDKAQQKATLEYTRYLEGHVLLIFWRVIDRLIGDKIVQGLNLASPFRLGFNFHDQGLITTVRIINW